MRAILGATLLALAGPQVDPKLQKARTALEQSAVAAAQALAKIAKDERVACVDLRPSLENPAAAANCPPLHEYLIGALHKEGVLAFSMEKERKLDIPYKKGKLEGGLPLSDVELKSLSERKVRFALMPRLVPKDGNCAVMFDVFDLQKGAVALSSDFGPVPTKSWPMGLICEAPPLPAMNTKILGFAAANFDKQVDRGECWDLPANPIKASGGRVEGYTFGREVKWEEAKPGDVVTFGTSGATGGHVMVLFRWNANRKAATILHQNVGGVRRVMFGTLGDEGGQRFAVWRP